MAALATSKSILHEQPDRFSSICSYHSLIKRVLALWLKFPFLRLAHKGLRDLSPACLFCCFSRSSFPMHCPPSLILPKCVILSPISRSWYVSLTAFPFLLSPLHSSPTQMAAFPVISPKAILQVPPLCSLRTPRPPRWGASQTALSSSATWPSLLLDYEFLGAGTMAPRI